MQVFFCWCLGVGRLEVVILSGGNLVQFLSSEGNLFSLQFDPHCVFLLRFEFISVSVSMSKLWNVYVLFKKIWNACSQRFQAATRETKATEPVLHNCFHCLVSTKFRLKIFLSNTIFSSQHSLKFSNIGEFYYNLEVQMWYLSSQLLLKKSCPQLLTTNPSFAY